MVPEVTLEGAEPRLGSFRPAVAAIRAEAGLPHELWFMDLRRTAVAHLARGGSTPSETAHITGHSKRAVVDLLKVYLPRDQTVAEAGTAKLEEYRARTKTDDLL